MRTAMHTHTGSTQCVSFNDMKVSSVKHYKLPTYTGLNRPKSLIIVKTDYRISEKLGTLN